MRRMAIVIVAGLLFGAVAAAALAAHSAPGFDRLFGSAADQSPAGVYTFNAATNTLKNLIPGGSEREDIRWSPDGKWIASMNTDNFLVDVIPAAGGIRRAFESIEWAPSGSRVAYAGRNGGLFAGPSTFTRGRLVAIGTGYDPIEWTTDGTAFVFGGGRSSSCCWRTLNVSRADGMGVRRLWAPPVTGRHDSWIDGAFWSPNGHQIAVAATINNAVAADGGGEFLYLVSPRSGAARRVVYQSDAGFSSWSGDGRWLILGSDTAMYRVTPAGGTVERLCRPCRSTTLSPDRSRAAFVADGGVWVVNVDGTGRRRIGDAPAATEITWAPDGDELGLTLRERDHDPGRIAVADLRTNSIRLLTHGRQDEVMIGLSSTGAYAAFFRLTPPSLWVIGADGAGARRAMTLATDKDLGPCPQVAWSPTAPVLAIANAPCKPS